MYLYLRKYEGTNDPTDVTANTIVDVLSDVYA